MSIKTDKTRLTPPDVGSTQQPLEFTFIPLSDVPKHSNYRGHGKYAQIVAALLENEGKAMQITESNAQNRAHLRKRVSAILTGEGRAMVWRSAQDSKIFYVWVEPKDKK